jgi:Immunity protein 31
MKRLPMKLGFYEKVLVTASREFPEYVGRVGVVLGISEDESRVYGYSVFFPGELEGLSFLPHELEGTGEFVDRSVLYDDNDVVRVRVEDGKGSLV